MNFTRHTYNTGGEKWMDFFIGFVGWFVVNGILSGIIYGLFVALTAVFVNADFETANMVQSVFSLVTGCLSLLVNLGALAYFGFTRYWITLGILGAFAASLVATICLGIFLGAACLALIATYSSSMGP